MRLGLSTNFKLGLVFMLSGILMGAYEFRFNNPTDIGLIASFCLSIIGLELSMR